MLVDTINHQNKEICKLPAKRKFLYDISAQRVAKKILKTAPKSESKDLVERINQFKDLGREVRLILASELVKTHSGAEALVLQINQYCFGDQEIKEEIIFKIATEEMGPWAVATHFEKLGIQDPKLRQELALELATQFPSREALCRGQTGPNALAKNLDKFVIEDRNLLQKLAFELADQENAISSLARNFRKFGIEDPKLKEQILWKIMRHGTWGPAVIARNFNEFGIDDPALKKKIAMTIAKDSFGARVLPATIKKFGFEDERFKQKLAFCLLDQEVFVNYFIENLEQFQFTDRKFLFELALKVSQNDKSSKIGKNLRKFQIEKIEDRKRLAQEMVKTNSGAASLARSIKQFDFQESEFRCRLAFIIVKHPGGAEALARNFQQFDLFDPDVKKNIAFEMVMTNEGAKALAQHFHKFGIHESKNEQELAIKIAKQQLGAAALVENFEQFGIVDCEIIKKLVFQIVKDEDGAQALVMHAEGFDYFLDFEFNDNEKKQLLLEAAAHEKGAVALVKKMEHFPIRNPEFFKTLLMECAKWGRGSAAIAKKIQSLEIHDLQFLQNLAKEMIKHIEGARAVVRHLENFGFEDKEFIIQLAFAINQVEYVHNLLFKNIHKFGLDSIQLRKLAKEAAQISSGAGFLPKHIEKFGICDPECYQELALEIACHAGGSHALVKHFDKFGFLDPVFIRKLALIIVQNLTGAIVLTENLEKFQFDDPEFVQSLLIKASQFDRAANAVANRIQYLDLNDKFKAALAFELSKNQEGAKAVLTHIKKFRFTDPDICRYFANLKQVLQLDLYETVEQKKIFLNPLLDWDDFPGKALQTPFALFETISKNQHLDTLLRYFNLSSQNRPTFDDFKKAWTSVFNQLKKEKLPTNTLQHLRKFAVNTHGLLASLDDMLQIEDRALKGKLALWMYYAIGRISRDLTEEQISLVYQSNILKILYDIRDMDLRYLLTDKFIQRIQNLKTKEKQKEFLTSTCKSRKALLVKLLLDELKLKDKTFEKTLVTPTKAQKRTKTHYRNDFLRDGNKLILLLKGLENLGNSKKIESKQIADCITYWTKLNDKNLTEELNSLNAIFVLEKEKHLHFDLESKSTKQILEVLKMGIEELIPGLRLKNPEQFERIFFRSRHPGALLVYLSGIKKLSSNEREKMMAIVREFIRDIDLGQFQENRYEGSEHLNTVFESRKGLKEAWKKGRRSLLTPYLSESSVDDEFDLADYLKTKVLDRHLPIDALPKLALLCGVSSTEVLTHHELDDLLSDLYRHPENLSHEKLNHIEEALRAIDPVSDFFEDIKELKKKLKPTVERNTEGWELVNSDHPLDLFLAGTEVGGSCQKISGFMGLNRCLMGYVMDGKHRIIAIKDEKKAIVGRAIFRLLFDEQKKEPCLFYERVYPGTLKAQYMEAMSAFALECGRELGLAVTTKNKTAGKPYKGYLTSYSCRAPYEYCDASSGEKSGEYKINGCCYL